MIYWRDWSSDVCSSDLSVAFKQFQVHSEPPKAPLKEVLTTAGMCAVKTSLSGALGGSLCSWNCLKATDSSTRLRTIDEITTIGIADRKSVVWGKNDILA